MSMSDSISQLLNKNIDVDTKVDILAKLQSQFESNEELVDVDGVIGALKQCLRTPNQHLTTATLLALPSFVQLLQTHPHASSSSSPTTLHSQGPHNIRQALLAFLPSGGVIDRLSEAREKARDAARIALVSIAGVAFLSATPCGSSIRGKEVAKNHESPMAMVEKHIKELGLGSKGARVREQTILSLVAIRREHSSFPIRPYLPQLVMALEDTDGTVRDCARASIITLFTGQGVTDAARADLKHEMTRRNVRKTIVNDVLSKLMAAGSVTGTEGLVTDKETEDLTSSVISHVSSASATRKPLPISRSATTGSIARTTSTQSVSTLERPDSRAGSEGTSTTADVEPVYIASTRDLEHEFAVMIPFFEGKETEQNWADRERSCVRIRGMLKGEAHLRYPDAFYHGLKNGVLEKTLKALASLRTTVSTQAALLYNELAIGMTTSFDHLMEIVFQPLVRVAGFTKRLIVKQTQEAVTSILTHTTLQPRAVIPYLTTTFQTEKNVQTRNWVMKHLTTILEVHGHRAKHAIESTGHLDALDKTIRKGLADQNPGVREVTRICYWLFDGIWPTHAQAILANLDSNGKKQLEKANPKPGSNAALVSVTTESAASKKSSVAAAIAASRAKAKVIATAPPTLRHAATSGAHTAAVAAAASGEKPGQASPPKRALSPANIRRATSPVVSARPTSPSSPLAGKGGMSPLARSTPSTMTRNAGMHRSVSSTSSSSSANGVVVAGRMSPTPIPMPRTIRPPIRSPPQSPTTGTPGPSSGAQKRRVTSPLGASTNKRVALTSSRSQSPGWASNVKPLMLSTRSPPLPPTTPMKLDGLIDDGELITAMHIPLPTEEDEFEEMNLMSFSSAYEKLTGEVPESVIHDSYRAQAQQAESAAAQLLEMVDEEDVPPPPPMPTPALKHDVDATAQNGKKVVVETTKPKPSTPKAKSWALMKEVNGFENSPAPDRSPSLAKTLFEKNDKSGVWWRTRRRFFEMEGLNTDVEPETTETLKTLVASLQSGTADLKALKRLIRICSNNPTTSPPSSPIPASGMLTPLSPSPFGKANFAGEFDDESDIWDGGKLFDQLLDSLLAFLDSDKSSEILEYGLILLMEMVQRQNAFCTGHERTVFSFLLDIRYVAKQNIYEATSGVRDALIERSDPVFGLTTIHRNLEDFLKKPLPDSSLAEARISSYCFGLVAMAKFILMLPAEVLEDQLPRIKGSLIKALSDQSSAMGRVREAAYATIIASQIKLRDETQVFALIGGLTENQKHLLTYEFEKVKARGPVGYGGDEESRRGLEKLAGKMRHLDALPTAI